MITFVCALSGAGAPAAADAGRLELARGGRTPYRILVPPNASRTEHAAAVELADHLNQITGATFPIQSGFVSPHGYQQRHQPPATVATEIMVGRSPRIEALELGVDWESLGDEGYVIRTVGERIMIAGGPRGGTLHGVYDFLENHLGCRWYTPNFSLIPQEPHLTLDPINEKYVPAFAIRRISNFDSFRAPWAFRNHLNFWYGHLYQEVLGLLADPRAADGYFNPNIAMASFWDAGLFQPTRLKPFLEKHPEAYALIKGERSPGQAYCWGNPDLLAFTLEQIDRWCREAPNANVLPLGMGDFRLHTCECELCARMVDRHTGPTGADPREFDEFADVAMAFIDDVCQALETKHPGLHPMTFAYNETVYPPSHVRPHKNLWVVFADVGQNCVFPIDKGANLLRGLDQLVADWVRLTDGKVLFYDYAMSPVLPPASFYPWPMLYEVAERFQAVRDVGASGACPSTVGGWDGPGQHLQSYILAHVLWNPDYDADEGIREFCGAYYGAAGRFVAQFQQDLNDRASYAVPATRAWHLQKNAGPNAPYGGNLRYEPRMLARWDTLFDQAEQAVADDPVLLERVKIERMAVQMAIFYTARSGDPLLTKAIDGFFPMARKFLDDHPQTRFMREGVYDRIHWLRPDEPGASPEPTILKSLDDFAQHLRVYAAREPWPAPAEPPRGKTVESRSLPIVTNSIGMKLVEIPAGTFQMGSHSIVEDEHPVHDVTLNPFLIGATEVTQSQYERVMDANPSHFDGDDLPVESVSHAEARAFCAGLSALPAEREAGRVYTLPTEAQWEYACRAGSTSAWSWGPEEAAASAHAWHAANGGGRTQPVGTREPNPWALFDLHGNVWEMVEAGYRPYPDGPVTDPPPSSGRSLVCRGGAYNETPFYLRSAIRGRAFIHFRPTRVLGFRVACRVEEPADGG